MKPKRIAKRLDLNKKTIANLDGMRMRFVFGGFPNTLPVECETVLTSCTNENCLYTRSCFPCDTVKPCIGITTETEDTNCC